MELARRSHLAPGALAVLVRLAHEAGYDAHWVHQQMVEGHHDAMQIARRFGTDAARELRQVIRNFAQGRNTNGQLTTHLRQHEQEALSNSPATAEAQTNMVFEYSDEPMHDNAEPAQTGLDTIKAQGPIWTHFPNTQRTRLRYRSTIYQVNSAAWIAHKVAFGNDQIQTATNLTNTGGGAAAIQTNEQVTGGPGLANAAAYDFSLPFLLQLRMTSPYNIVKALGTQAGGGTVSEPNWISMWDGMYQYYVVQETDWGVTLHFGTPLATSTGTQTSANIAGSPQNYKLKVFWRYTNQDDPPTQWTYNTNRTANTSVWTDNQAGTTQITQDSATTQAVTGNAGTINLTSDDYEQMGGWKHKTISWNTTHATTCHLGGKYKFGQCKMDVKTLMTTDAHGANANPTAEGMSLTRATPQFPEILSIIIVNDSASNEAAGLAAPMTIQIDTNQQVDFADLRANYKFPTPNLCTAQSTNLEFTPEQYFKRGAAYS